MEFARAAQALAPRVALSFFVQVFMILTGFRWAFNIHYQKSSFEYRLETVNYFALEIRHLLFNAISCRIGRTIMILAQLSVFTIGESTSLSRNVKKGIEVIKASGYHYEIGGMSTCIEVPDLDALFDLVKKVHQAHLDEGGQRILIDLKVDDRRDKKATIQTKRNAVK